MSDKLAVHWMRSNNLEEKITNLPPITYKVSNDNGLVEMFINGTSVVEWVDEDGEPEILFNEFKRILFIGMLMTQKTKYDLS